MYFIMFMICNKIICNYKKSVVTFSIINDIEQLREMGVVLTYSSN